MQLPASVTPGVLVSADRPRSPIGPLAGAVLPVFWMEGYAGGLFVPFRDATSGAETYGAGRYLLDTVKGADRAATGSAASCCSTSTPPITRRAPTTRSGTARSRRRRARLALPVRAGERLADWMGPTDVSTESTCPRGTSERGTIVWLSATHHHP